MPTSSISASLKRGQSRRTSTFTKKLPFNNMSRTAIVTIGTSSVRPQKVVQQQHLTGTSYSLTRARLGRLRPPLSSRPTSCSPTQALRGRKIAAALTSLGRLLHALKSLLSRRKRSQPKSQSRTAGRQSLLTSFRTSSHSTRALLRCPTPSSSLVRWSTSGPVSRTRSCKSSSA